LRFKCKKGEGSVANTIIFETLDGSFYQQ